MLNYARVNFPDAGFFIFMIGKIVCTTLFDNDCRFVIIDKIRVARNNASVTAYLLQKQNIYGEDCLIVVYPEHIYIPKLNKEVVL